MSARRGTPPAGGWSRRRFVALAGAGLAALSTGATTRPPKTAAPAAKTAPPPPSAAKKEFDRQRASTLAALKVLRAYPLPPGGDLPVVFKPMRNERKGR